LFGTEADRFLDWLAHIEQKPGELPHTHWLHISPYQGTGRSWIGQVLYRVWNPYVALGVNLPEMLEPGGFNVDLAGKLLAVVEEINEGGTKKWSHAENLKSELTRTHRKINDKNEKAVWEHNAMRLLAFTQHNTGLPITKEDRRLWVAKYPNKPKEPGYYRKLYGLLLDEDFIRAVSLYLLTRDISEFDPNITPEVTQAKRQAIDASQSDEDRAIEEVFEHWPGCAISNACLLEIFSLANNTPFNQRSFSAFMKHKTIFEKRVVTAKLPDKNKSSKYTVWLMSGKEGYERMTDAQIREDLQTGEISVDAEVASEFYQKHVGG
jgi:hypothetical protein